MHAAPNTTHSLARDIAARALRLVCVLAVCAAFVASMRRYRAQAPRGDAAIAVADRRRLPASCARGSKRCRASAAALSRPGSGIQCAARRHRSARQVHSRRRALGGGSAAGVERQGVSSPAAAASPRALRTAQVTLPYRGTLHVCASSTVKLAADSSAPAGEVPGLLIALDHGAVEMSFAASTAREHNADMLLTPYFRILIGGPNAADVKVRLGEHGDTCVDNAGANAPYVVVTSVFEGGLYRVQPGQRVMFQHGSLRRWWTRKRNRAAARRRPQSEAERVSAGAERGSGAHQPPPPAAANQTAEPARRRQPWFTRAANMRRRRSRFHNLPLRRLQRRRQLRLRKRRARRRSPDSSAGSGDSSSASSARSED